MNYLPDDAARVRVADAVLHTRNKNIVVEASRRTLAYRVVQRLWEGCTLLRQRMLLRSAASVIVSEQVIENTFVLRQLDTSVRKVLDFGAFESTLPLALTGLGLEVTVVDQRRYPFSAEGLRVIQHDILRPLADLESDFDLVYSISTIEHVGLGHYGDPARGNGDQVALGHLWAKVRPGGRLVFSVPAGRPTVQRGYRVYDEASLRAILPHEGEISFFLKRGRRGVWHPSCGAEIAAHEYENYFAPAPLEGVALAVLRKPTGNHGLIGAS